jgi:hypothetical protein
MTDIDVSQRPHNQPNPGAIPAQSRSSIHSIPGHRGVHLAPLQKCRLQICLLRLCLRVHLSHVRVECWKGACDHNILLDIMKCLICPKKQGFRYFVWAVLTFLGRYWLVAGVTIQSYLGYNKNLLGFWSTQWDDLIFVAPSIQNLHIWAFSSENWDASPGCNCNQTGAARCIITDKTSSRIFLKRLCKKTPGCRMMGKIQELALCLVVKTMGPLRIFP